VSFSRTILADALMRSTLDTRNSAVKIPITERFKPFNRFAPFKSSASRYRAFKPLR
jgi:hypothetical protein